MQVRILSKRLFETKNIVICMCHGFENTKAAGKFAELRVIGDLLKHRARVFQEVTDGVEVDVIAHFDSRYFRIQTKLVKSTTSLSGVTNVGVTNTKLNNRTRKREIHYTSAVVDVIALFVVDLDIVLYVPLSIFDDKHARSFLIRIIPEIATTLQARKTTMTASAFTFSKTFGGVSSDEIKMNVASLLVTQIPRQKNNRSQTILDHIKTHYDGKRGSIAKIARDLSCSHTYIRKLLNKSR